MKRRKNK